MSQVSYLCLLLNPPSINWRGRWPEGWALIRGYTFVKGNTTKAAK